MFPCVHISMRFSPLREGDTSVAECPEAWFRPLFGFSPLREGDTSVASVPEAYAGYFQGFSPLREGDTSVARSCWP